MPRACSICTHAERRAIDAAIVARVANRAIARQYGTTKDCVSRHVPHVRSRLARIERDEVRQGATLAAQLAEERALVAESIGELAMVKSAGARVELRLKCADRLHRSTELEFGSKTKVEISEAVKNMTPAQVADELAAAVLEMAATDEELAVRLRTALDGRIGTKWTAP